MKICEVGLFNTCLAMLKALIEVNLLMFDAVKSTCICKIFSYLLFTHHSELSGLMLDQKGPNGKTKHTSQKGQLESLTKASSASSQPISTSASEQGMTGTKS